jgi:hypothetical protein
LVQFRSLTTEICVPAQEYRIKNSGHIRGPIQNIQLNDEVLILGFNNNLTKQENAKYLRFYLATNGKYGNTGTNIFSKTQQIHQKLYIFNKIKGHLKPKS